MNKLSTEKRSQVVAALVEGNSIRATVRMTGASKNTIAKLLVELGAACADYLDKALVNLNCKRIQCDEIWSFCYAKEKNLPEEMRGVFGYGDVWTWTAMDADTKLIAAWIVGGRDAGTAYGFIQDLAKRLAHRVQLTTDGHRAYVSAVEGTFGSEIDYAMLVKLYGNDRDSEVRYSPAECIGAREVVVTGRPDPKHISTSYVERQNLTMRMGMRRFTRLTNGFSKKLDNHIAAIAIHYMHYNFCRVHQTLRVTPAMEAGVSDHVWTMEELVSLLDKSGKIAA
ncbi:MAG TPA: IS1 family transposase [Candidatus Acidoferrales bacterium]|jgi:IS1 family transposase|nr:IS1 family transposase [Candidatus Acidoferrales bacterium]